ncbi:MAG: gfo/Idh/MocA family oxidoreductase, partial [Planctomycetaceae bacterium]
DEETLTVHDGKSEWASQWEQKSASRAKANHIRGWRAGDHGSVLEEPEYMKLAGPWKDGKDPGA